MKKENCNAFYKKQAKTLKYALKSVYAVHGYSKLQHM